MSSTRGRKGKVIATEQDIAAEKAIGMINVLQGIAWNFSPGTDAFTRSIRTSPKTNPYTKKEINELIFGHCAAVSSHDDEVQTFKNRIGFMPSAAQSFEAIEGQLKYVFSQLDQAFFFGLLQGDQVRSNGRRLVHLRVQRKHESDHRRGAFIPQQMCIRVYVADDRQLGKYVATLAHEMAHAFLFKPEDACFLEALGRVQAKDSYAIIEQQTQAQGRDYVFGSSVLVANRLTHGAANSQTFVPAYPTTSSLPATSSTMYAPDHSLYTSTCGPESSIPVVVSSSTYSHQGAVSAPAFASPSNAPDNVSYGPAYGPDYELDGAAENGEASMYNPSDLSAEQGYGIPAHASQALIHEADSSMYSAENPTLGHPDYTQETTEHVAEGSIHTHYGSTQHNAISGGIITERASIAVTNMMGPAVNRNNST
ncbi:hypothetical protein PFICI_03202 [Pestalotiopsis fici W106-1]|uniref:Uncharacterized protein n=1 Tax=Pestalotiopsis fici (strain W106-1 / CGMCC3.15140) TaxID=1229662 RepID=W3XIA3_PESFW|nr:uncharacterized protein PFICI_03202 [Pestalotiopsis fici W106-1]ETS85177.1 hypothetical protein PFICI_03202 [Pestalotiopsis fici W106-1]